MFQPGFGLMGVLQPFNNPSGAGSGADSMKDTKREMSMNEETENKPPMNGNERGFDDDDDDDDEMEDRSKKIQKFQKKPMLKKKKQGGPGGKPGKKANSQPDKNEKKSKTLRYD
jgi:hypothetical protein